MKRDFSLASYHIDSNKTQDKIAFLFDVEFSANHGNKFVGENLLDFQISLILSVGFMDLF